MVQKRLKKIYIQKYYFKYLTTITIWRGQS